MKNAYGGVVVDREGRVLLREAANHKHGDVWTFPKGRKEPGESDEAAALREVCEETGWSASIFERIPGRFEGTVSTNVYFVMEAGEEGCERDRESEAIRWVTRDEAPDLLRLSTSQVVVKRELDVLAAAGPIIERMLAGYEDPSTSDGTSPVPHLLSRESTLWRDGTLVAGVDETGRGAWAGPLVAAAVILPMGFDPSGIRDSKKMDPHRREAAYARLLVEAEAVGVAWVSPKEIDRATDEEGFDACHAALLVRAVLSLSPSPGYVLIDHVVITDDDLPIPHESVTHGESESVSIAAASIIAKVTRDRMMDELAGHLDPWGLARNKGYGGSLHEAALSASDASPVHRRSSKGVRRAISSSPGSADQGQVT